MLVLETYVLLVLSPSTGKFTITGVILSLMNAKTSEIVCEMKAVV